MCVLWHVRMWFLPSVGELVQAGGVVYFSSITRWAGNVCGVACHPHFLSTAIITYFLTVHVYSDVHTTFPQCHLSSQSSFTTSLNDITCHLMCHSVTQICHFVTYCITTSFSRRSTISFSLWGCMVLPTRASLFRWIRKRATAPSRPGRDRETGAHRYRGWTHAHRQRHTQLPHMNTLKQKHHTYYTWTHLTHTPHICTAHVKTHMYVRTCIHTHSHTYNYTYITYT